MHDSNPDGQVTHGLTDQAMCTQCHREPQYTTDVAQHTHHAPATAGSDCLNCHMPHNSYALFAAIRSHRIKAPSVVASVEHGTPNACNLCHLDKTLDWTAKALSKWYGHEPVKMSDEQRTVAAGVLWMLKGNAAQRAIVAWNAGWAPARKASGDGWLGPYLAKLLADPYGVVRYVAHRSLETATPAGGEEFSYDFLGDRLYLDERAEAAAQRWAIREESGRAELLLDASGRLDTGRFERIYSQRDNRPVSISE
jgi:hypothetical protein